MTTGGEFGARGSGKLLWVWAVTVACSHAAPPATTAPASSPPPPPPAAPAPAAAPAEAEPEALSPQERATAPRDDEEMRSAPGNAASAHAGDLQTAQAELEHARVELNRALAVRAPRPASGGGAPAAASRGAADAAPPAKAEKKSAESSCATACRAFASLERAADAVCRITGEKDGRCAHAHAVVSDAKQRVAVCTCTSE